MANIEIGGRLHSTATGNVVTGANEVLDDTKNKKQSVINAEVDETIGDDNTAGTIKGRIKTAEGKLDTLNGDSSTLGSVAKAVADAKIELIGGATSNGNTLKKVEDRTATLETAVGSNGSVDQRITAAKSEVIGDAAGDYNTLGKLEDKIQAEASARQDAITAETNRATTRENQIYDLVHTPEQHYVTVATYADLANIASPSDDTIYRVSSYNGKTSQVDNTVYSEYGYDGTNFVFLCVKSQIDEVYDISAHHSNNTYVDLAAALDGGNNIPQELRRGGMSVKFVRSSDNKYVQARLMANTFTTDVTQWQVVEKEPTPYSKNLAESGGISKRFTDQSTIANAIIWNGDAKYTGRTRTYDKKLLVEIPVFNTNYRLLGSVGTFTSTASTTDCCIRIQQLDANDNEIDNITYNANASIERKILNGCAKVLVYLYVSLTGESSSVEYTLDNLFLYAKSNIDEQLNSLDDEINLKETTHTTVTSKAPAPTGFYLRKGFKYIITGKANSTFSPLSQGNVGYWIYTDSWTQIKHIDVADFLRGVSFEYTPTEDCRLDVRTYTDGVSVVIDTTIEHSIFDLIEIDVTKQITISDKYPIPTGFILRKGVEYTITGKADATFTPSNVNNVGYYIYTTEWSLIQKISVSNFVAGYTFKYTPSVDCRLDVRTTVEGSSNSITTSLKYFGTNEDIVKSIVEPIVNDLPCNFWNGKNVVVYGDSITAQGNGENRPNSFLYYAYQKHKFNMLYGRGVGSQTYKWNSMGWYTEVGTNGNFLGRFKYDAQGNITSNVINAESYTQQDVDNIENALGKTIEVHHGAFCSWDRITTMIPSSLRNSIDLVIVAGGTNDFSSTTEAADAEPVWVNEDATDAAWANDTLYKGGDYDISTFNGGIASTLMKLAVWCPNAVIVLATPFPRFDLSTNMQFNYNDANHITFRRMAEIEKHIAEYVGVNVIDANGECGINGVNFHDLQTDGVHPNEAGRKMYGKVFVGELCRIANKIL